MVDRGGSKGTTGQRLGGDITQSIRERAEHREGPNPLETREFHRGSDVDAGYQSQHHTIGSKAHQAAAGNHEHRYQGIWLYKDTGGTHNSTGNWVQTSWQQAKRWDKELYKKVDAQTIEIVQDHTAMMYYKIQFVANAAGHRGVRLTVDGSVQNTKRDPIGGIGAFPLQTMDVNMSVDLKVGEQLALESFQNSGGNLNIDAGQFITFWKIEKTGPRFIDVEGLGAGGIIPQIPGPVIASRKLFFDAAW